MRVLVVVNSLQAGGAEKSALKLATSMSLNHQVVLATLRDDLDHYPVPKEINRINFGDIFTHSHNRIVNVFLRGRYKIGYNWALKLRELRKKIIALKVDAVIVFESLVGSVISFALFESKIPLVVSERVNPNPKVYEPHKIAQLVRPFIYRHGVICTVQSREFALWCQENWDIKPVITPNHLLEGEYETPDRKEFDFRFVCVGRYAYQKGYETLLASWQIVESKNSRAKLTLYGAGRSELYIGLAKELNLSRVTFCEAQIDLGSVYREADCLISASRFEGFPNVVLEALARGVPVIATDSSPVISELKDDDAVQTVPVDDYIALADEILKKCEYGVSIDTRNRAFEIAREYNWQHVVSSWENAIQSSMKSMGFRAKRSK